MSIRPVAVLPSLRNTRTTSPRDNFDQSGTVADGVEPGAILGLAYMVAVHSTRATLEAEADGDAVEVTVYGQLCRKRLLSYVAVKGLLDDRSSNVGAVLSLATFSSRTKVRFARESPSLAYAWLALLNFMVRSADGWLTKEEVVNLKFAMHLGDFLTAEGRLERTPSTNELLFVLRSCTIALSWASIHPGRLVTLRLQ